MKKSDGNNEGNVPSYTLKKKPSTKIPANIAAICPLPISKMLELQIQLNQVNQFAQRVYYQFYHLIYRNIVLVES